MILREQIRHHQHRSIFPEKMGEKTGLKTSEIIKLYQDLESTYRQSHSTQKEPFTIQGEETDQTDNSTYLRELTAQEKSMYQELEHTR